MEESLDQYDPFQYSWMSINYFFSLWCAGIWCQLVLLRFLPSFNVHTAFIARRYEGLPTSKKRKIVIYVLRFVATTFALVAQLQAGQELFFREKISDPSQLKWGFLALQAIAILYVWELIYRQEISIPLFIHHVVTLLFIQLFVASFNDTRQLIYLRLALIFGFHATTEQSSLFALFLFRLEILNKELQSWVFLFAAVQTIIIKTAATVIFFIMFALRFNTFMMTSHHGNWGWFWIFATIPLMLCLYSAQVFASWILFSLGIRCRRLATLGYNQLDTSSVSDIGNGKANRHDGMLFVNGTAPSKLDEERPSSPPDTLKDIPAVAGLRSEEHESHWRSNNSVLSLLGEDDIRELAP